jgi:hypothetical protein
MRGRRAALVGEAARPEPKQGYQLRLYEPGPPRLVFEATSFRGPAKFHGMDLSQTRFQQVYLGKVSFLHSQIHQTRFISCEWGQGPEYWRLVGRERPWWRWRRPRLLYDELLWRLARMPKKRRDRLQKKLEKNLLLAVSAFLARSRKLDRLSRLFHLLRLRYRLARADAEGWKSLAAKDSPKIRASDIEVLALQLKQSLEASKDPITAGDFHFAAMEMKRAQAWEKSRLLRFGGLWLYKTLSGYGERPGRAFFWLAVLAVGFTAGLGLWPSLLEQGAQIPHPGVEDAFFHALSHMLPFKLGSLSAAHQRLTGPLRWLTLLDTVLGTSLFTMFVLALRRRFKR